MKLKAIVATTLFITLISCNTKGNSEDFIRQYSGRYLYNSDEVIEAFFKKTELYLKWHGATNIKPLKVDENIFYVKEMNEKIQFLINPSDQKKYMVLVPKEENKSIEYNYIKLGKDEKVPSEYLKNNQFEKALTGYLAIKKTDSLNVSIKENNFNSLGYKKLRQGNLKEAINIFKINVALYPNSSNVYDSLAEAYMKNKDTLQAIINYKKALKLNPSNNRAKKYIKKLDASHN